MDNFQQFIDTTENIAVVVYHSNTSDACKMLDPVVEELAGDWQDKMKTVKIDVDRNPEVAMQYQVFGVPTLILFKNGQPMERTSGFLPKKKLEAKFAPHVG